MARFATLLAVVVALSQFPGGEALPGVGSRGVYAHQKRANGFRKLKGWPGYRFPIDPWGVVINKEDTIESTIVLGSGVAGIGAAPTDTVAVPSSATNVPYPTLTALPTAAFPATIINTGKNSTSSISIRVSTSSAVPTSIRVGTSSQVSTSTSSTVETSSSVPPPPPPPPSSSSQAAAPSSTVVRQSSTRPAPSPSPEPTPSAAPAPEPKPTSSAVAQAPPSSGDSTAQSDINAYLSAHNTIRAQHGAAPLTWSQELADKAQQWANGCVFKHSGGSLGPFGENLAAGTGNGYGIAQAVKSWTDEVSQYNSNNPQPSHFTQVVWKGSTQVGCAVQNCDGIFSASFGKAHFHVCEYSPAGNVIGQFAQNVQA